jgi:elongation of very long chain fatty acids protein 6
MEYIRAFDKMQQNFVASDVADWMGAHTEIPVICVTAYLALVFYGRDYMAIRPAWNLKPLFTVWNFILSVFSFIGCAYTMPVLIENLSKNGFYFTVCEKSPNWYSNGPSGFWTMIFCLSKIPEFMDTVFLVFQKKPVIFLHWYHHTTVMLYCWFAYTTLHTVGVYFAAMNYIVHSIMYSYYFLMSVSGPTRKLVKPVAPLITFLQLAQMVGGLVLIVTANVFSRDEAGCEGNSHTILRAALVMYASYFALFLKFFAEAYIFKSKKGGSGKKPTKAE